MHRRVTIAVVTAGMLAFTVPHTPAQANELVGGVSDVISGALAIPMGIVAGTFGGPLILGTVGGALHGTLRAIGLTTRGAFRLVGVAVPLAAKIAPLIPLFL